MKKHIKNPFKSKNNTPLTENGKELLDKLESVEEFFLKHTPNGKENKRKVKREQQKKFYSELSYFRPLEQRFPEFNIQVKNEIKTNSLKTFSNYFEIFSHYSDNLLAQIKRGGLEKHVKCHIKCEFIRGNLQFSLLIENLRFAQSDQVQKDIKRTKEATGHLLTPFKGKIESYIKKSPSRQVQAILVKMKLTPLRQHISNNHFIQQ